MDAAYTVHSDVSVQ